MGNYLALITMQQDRMVFWIEEDFKGVGDALKGDLDVFGFMCWNRDLEMLDVVFLHEGNVFGGIVLGDKGTVFSFR